MNQHEESGSGFVPDAYDRRGLRAVAGSISPLRSRWRMPVVAAATMAVVAALCLHTGSAAHATAAAAKPANLAVHSAVDTGAKSSLTSHVENAAATSSGGVHGALNQYDGSGGGVQFWFDPNTGDLTVAVGSGIGATGGGVLGTYAAGTSPAANSDLYASVDLSAGTYTTVNVSGAYSLSDGVFDGTVSATVEGRTLTISSNGSSGFAVSVYAAAGATGFTGTTGVYYTYSFNFTDVVDYVWHAILDLYTGEYTLVDNDSSGEITTPYEDDSTDLTTTDASSSDDSSDASDAGDDSGDGGDGSSCSASDTYKSDQPSSAAVHSASTIVPNEEIEDGCE